MEVSESAEVGTIDPRITGSTMHSAHYLQLNQLDSLLEPNTRLLAAQSYKLLNKTSDATSVAEGVRSCNRSVLVYQACCRSDRVSYKCLLLSLG